jgi:hypothetical protein
MTVRDDLIAARALIDTPEKWGKGDGGYNGPEKPLLCAYGACGAVAQKHGSFIALTAALDRALPDEMPEGLDPYDGLETPAFNDDPDTTHADIMALFDRAIAAQPQP